MATKATLPDKKVMVTCIYCDGEPKDKNCVCHGLGSIDAWLEVSIITDDLIKRMGDDEFLVENRFKLRELEDHICENYFGTWHHQKLMQVIQYLKVRASVTASLSA